jgi:hypothetical protein
MHIDEAQTVSTKSDAPNCVVHRSNAVDRLQNGVSIVLLVELENFNGSMAGANHKASAISRACYAMGEQVG